MFGWFSDKETNKKDTRTSFSSAILHLNTSEYPANKSCLSQSYAKMMQRIEESLKML